MLTRGRRPNAQGAHVWGYGGVHKHRVIYRGAADIMRRESPVAVVYE